MVGSKRSIILLIGMGTLWYANLVLLIVSVTEFPGSHQVRDYDRLIGVVLLVLTACFRQTYVIWKRGQPVDDE